MATIKTEKQRLHNGADFIMKIKYSKGYFEINLPPDMVKEMFLEGNNTKAIGNTEFEAERLYKQKLKEWVEFVKVEEKVIVFNAKFAGGLFTENYREVANGGKYIPAYERHGYHNESIMQFCGTRLTGLSDTGLGLHIVWAVYKKETISNNVKYSFVSGRPIDSYGHRDYIRKDFTEIPYSPEKEQFFLSLDESFANMINSVFKALGDLTPEKLELLVVSGIKLLGN